MADFLSEEWFAQVNESLAAAGPPPVADPVRVVLDLADAPSALPHAITLTLSPDGAGIAPGDHLAADAMVRLSFADARALVGGDVDSATAIREGRVKVRGDVDAVVALVDWLRRAHPHARG
ncbi:MAG: SCP2 sterol-binding domain-containing protein [Acidimicrobiales bacterium]